jgi:hypothetical protein
MISTDDHKKLLLSESLLRIKNKLACHFSVHSNERVARCNQVATSSLLTNILTRSIMRIQAEKRSFNQHSPKKPSAWQTELMKTAHDKRVLSLQLVQRSRNEREPAAANVAQVNLFHFPFNQ